MMTNKIIKSLESYKNRNARKERKYEELRKLSESQDLTIKQEIEFEKLHTEMSLLKSFIEEMEYFLED